MRLPLTIALLSAAAPLLAAQIASSPAATPEAAAPLVLRHEFIDPNGRHVDTSGDETIWTTHPPQHAVLEIQVCPPGTDFPEPVSGRVSRRPGIAGVPIYVDAEDSDVTFEPADPVGGWVTDEEGVFRLTVRVPPREGAVRLIFRAEDPRAAPLTMTLHVKSPNWILWIVLGMLGGLALFLYGMEIGSGGLQEAAGGRFRDTLQALTNRPVRGVLVGTGITIFTQSSSATTVMLVSFVRAGLLSLRQTFGPIFGAAIGTTLTVQLLAFKIQAYALPLMAAGFLIMFFGRRAPRTAAIGKVIFGFGMIFFGMLVMGEVIAPLKSSPAFREMIAHLTSRPFWCLVVVTIFTAIIQSSGATIGIALTLGNQGLITLDQALPIIFGANIGTCITAFFAAAGGGSDAVRVALAHLIYKVVTVFLFFFWFMPDVLAWCSQAVSGLMADWLPWLSFLEDTTARQMANADTIMCVLGAVLAVAFFQMPLERVVMWLVPSPPEEKREGRAKYLDSALLATPQLAIGATVREISRMGRLVEEMVKRSKDAFETRDPDLISWLHRRDDKVDRAFNRINDFLTKLTADKPGEEVTKRAIGLLYMINDLESLGDLVVKNFIPIIDKMIDRDLHFSEAGAKELGELHDLVIDSLTKVMVAFTNPDERDFYEEVITRQEELIVRGRRLHLHHLRRLQAGHQESVETSSTHLDVISCLLRMHYLCHSIAWTASRGVSVHEEMG